MKKLLIGTAAMAAIGGTALAGVLPPLPEEAEFGQEIADLAKDDGQALGETVSGAATDDGEDFGRDTADSASGGRAGGD